MTSIRAVVSVAIKEYRLQKLVSGKKYIVEGQRLEVNPSVDRYKRTLMKEAAN